MTPETHVYEAVEKMEKDGIKTSLNNICKVSEFDFTTTKKALRSLYKEGVLDTDDDGRYFIKA